MLNVEYQEENLSWNLNQKSIVWGRGIHDDVRADFTVVDSFTFSTNIY